MGGCGSRETKQTKVAFDKEESQDLKKLFEKLLHKKPKFIVVFHINFIF